FSAARRALHTFPTRRSSDLVRWDTGPDDLFVLRDVGVHHDAIGHEQLLLWSRVLPPHLAGLLDDQPAALGDLFSEHAAFIGVGEDRKSTRLNSSHQIISYAV